MFLGWKGPFRRWRFKVWWGRWSKTKLLAHIQFLWDVSIVLVGGERGYNEDDPKIFFSYKKIGTLKVKDYRSISLVNRVYKIIFKILANRLGEILGRITFFWYVCFGEDHYEALKCIVRNRQILDSIIITNKCLDSS